MARNFVKVLLLATLALSFTACTKKWDPAFKVELRGAVEEKLVEFGVDPQYTGPIAACMMDYSENEVPDQKKMEDIVYGKVKSDLGARSLNSCACAIDPAAKATPDYCK